jgi:hypothetical protein
MFTQLLYVMVVIYFSIFTRLRAIVFRFSARVQIFVSAIATGPVLEFTQFSVGWLQGFETPGRELEHTLPYSA